MITFKNVSKRYGGNVDALSKVNLELPAGEMAFLTGHSGAGKTTLLKLITGQESPSQGHLIVNEQTLNNISKHRLNHLRRSIGLIAQSANLLDDRNIFDNVALPLQITGYKPADIKRRVHAALDKVGLLSKVKLQPSMLSEGEKQRINIARAVVNKPKLLLADEPTGNLDPTLASEIMQLFSQFNQVGVSVLIASHDLALIASLPYRMLTLKNGQLI
jgi:cell division transport system ATP-binding protein